MNESELLDRLFHVLKDHRVADDGESFHPFIAPEQLEPLLELDRGESSGDWEAIFAWIDSYLRYGVKTAHPMFVNRMWSDANLPSMLAEMVAAASNTSSCTYESAPVAVLMERYMIRQLLELVGFEQGEGQMTTGSSNANMIAMMCARNRTLEHAKSEGLQGAPRLYAFVNADAHYSMDKAANILGIGTEQLIKVAYDDQGRMDAGDLKDKLDALVAAGGVPFFVGATAGTTVRGAYDPLEPLLALRQRYGFWLHVDGAWGGAAVMSERLRQRYLAGLEYVDSFTCDFHKMLGSALMCNVLLLNRSEHALGRTLAAGDVSYIFHDDSAGGANEVIDPGSVSLQCGRRVDSLKWFLDWKFYGRDGFAKRVERYLELCAYAEGKIAAMPELELTAPRASFNVCFRYIDKICSNELNQQIRKALHRGGIALIGSAYIEQNFTLRLLIANQQFTEQQIDILLEHVVALGQELSRGGGNEN